MYLAIPSQTDCVRAWREAVRAVDAQPGHHAYNVVIDVANPVANSASHIASARILNEFLAGHAKPIETVANTIFPASLYYRHGAPEFFEVFKKRVLGKVSRNGRWSGYYFERMIQYPTAMGKPHNQRLRRRTRSTNAES